MSLNEAFLDDARKRMVDSQLRPNKITDPRILEAMRHLPRERFLPPDRAILAYTDQNIGLGAGRVMLQPMVLARMVQAAAPAAGERVLAAASGTGYAAALLAALGCEVTALDNHTDTARAALAEIAPGVSLVTGPLTAGWAANAPYDLILIEGAVPAVPLTIASQLKPGGRLLTIIGGDGGTAHAAEAELAPGGVSVRALFDCQCPILPEFAPAPAFEF